MSLEQAHCLALWAPSLDLRLENYQNKKEVGAREGFPYHIVKLMVILFYNGDNSEVDFDAYNTFLSESAVKSWIHLEYIIPAWTLSFFDRPFISVVCGNSYWQP